MSKSQIESMINFKYFVKLRKTKKASATEFFASFFSSQIPKKTEERKYKMNIFRYKDLNPYSAEDVLIEELKKPIINENTIVEMPSGKINNYLNNSNHNENLERNINVMINILMKNKRCNRYFIYNCLEEKHIRLLCAFATHEFFLKGCWIYSSNIKPNACYFIIRGKVSLRTFNPDKIRSENHKNKYNFLSIFNNIENEDKINGRYIDDDDDKISIEHFISKTNLITNQQDDNTISRVSPKKKKTIHKTLRRSFTKDPNFLKKTFHQTPQKIVEDRILTQNLNELQRNLSCEVRSFAPGQFFGEWDLILDKPHQETAYADENTDLLVINKKFFDKYFLKHILKIDNDRRIFLTKRISFLHINNVVNLQPEFYDKDAIIYTQFDFAKEFFIIYKGRGALKIIKNNNCKKKNEVIFEKNDMKTLCYVDKGCVVGLEACKEGRKKYDNNFVIIEDNTIIYRIPIKGVNEDSNYMKKKNRIQLKRELGNLYLVQNEILPKTNLERKKLTEEESKNKKIEEKINNIFFDSKDYFWRTILDKKRMNMKSRTIHNINDLNSYKYKSQKNKKFMGKIGLRKTISTELHLHLRKSQTRNKNFKFLTSANKNPKETSTNFSFPEKEEESKKSSIKNNNAFNSFNSISLFSNNYSEKSHHKNSLSFPKSNYEVYKENIINDNIFNDKNYMTIKNFKSPNYLTEEKMQTENKLTTLDSYNDNTNKFLTSNNLYKRNKFLKRKKRMKIPKNYFLNKYITLTAKISKENDINYNSGLFKMPLIGLCRKNNLI